MLGTRAIRRLHSRNLRDAARAEVLSSIAGWKCHRTPSRTGVHCGAGRERYSCIEMLPEAYDVEQVSTGALVAIGFAIC